MVTVADEQRMKLILSKLYKGASLEAFELDVVLSFLTTKIAPLVIGSGNIPTLFAYQAIKKLLDDLKVKQLKAMEESSPMPSDDQYAFPILERPSYAVQADLSNDDLEELGEELAERAHERWMDRERAKGNEDSTNMVPYAELPEEDKESDRDYAYEFMNLLDEQGFEVVPG